MAQWKTRSKRKITGGIVNKNTKKKRYMRGRDFVPAYVGAIKRRKLRIRGGGEKLVVLAADVANVAMNGKVQKSKILSVVENAANRQFVRRNIITRGAIINTELGKARVTSRPGQHGMINAVLIEEKPAKGKA